jgi:hypothetical protein
MDNADRRISEQIQTLNVEGLKNFHPQFKDNCDINLVLLWQFDFDYF